MTSRSSFSSINTSQQATEPLASPSSKTLSLASAGPTAEIAFTNPDPFQNGSSNRPGLLPSSSFASSLNENEEADVSTVTFDEAVLRNLCDIDCGLPLLLDRLRQSTASCKEASIFFKKRSQLEEEYARANLRLARSTLDSYREGEGKAGTFITSYAAFLRTHELISDNHMRFSTQLNEMSEQMQELARETERARKNGKELGAKLDKNLTDSEASMEKARIRFDSAVEELERCLVTKAGESARSDPSLVPHAATSPSNPNFGSAPPASKRTFGKAMSKLKSSGKGIGGSMSGNSKEEDLRKRMTDASEAYRREVQDCQATRKEHWVTSIPRVLRGMKESADEIDNGTQFHLSRYAYLYEHLLLQDGITVSPPGGIEEGPGLKAVVEAIDSREDFRKYMEHYNVAWAQSPAGMKGPAKRGEDMLDRDGYVALPRPPSSLSNHTSPNLSVSNMNMNTAHQTYSSPQPMSTSYNNSSSKPHSFKQKSYFGVSLNDLMNRDSVEVPRILEDCTTILELHALDNVGIYRLSGTTSRIQRLKTALDTDIDRVDLSREEYLSDLNIITGVLKLWFRELPDPLMTFELYPQLIEAAKIENDRLRHIRLHEKVNDLPDAHYATLKFMMGHLDKVQQHGSKNSMGISNLAIVFGPTFFRPPPGEEAKQLHDMTWQCKAVETILSHYEAIFVPTEE